MKDLMTALETFVDARIEVDRIRATPESTSDLDAATQRARNLGAIERSNQARADLVARLHKLILHPPPQGDNYKTIEKMDPDEEQRVVLWIVPVPSWIPATFKGKDTKGRYRFEICDQGYHSFDGDVPIRPL